jgi:hypothetical protein
MRILNKKLIKHDLFISALLVLIIGSLVFISFRNTKAENISNFCKPYQSPSGTNTVILNVPAKGEYHIWLNIESPMQISFYTIPNNYNPLLVGVDGRTCLEIGQGSSISLNSWTWLSSTGIDLNKGNHTFSISGTNISYKELKLIDSTCIPLNDGANCN